MKILKILLQILLRMNFINIKDDGENFLFQNSLQIKKPISVKSGKNEIIGVRPEDISIKQLHNDSSNLKLMLASLIMAKN